MQLKKLEIQGFKSFADRTEIRFEHGVTGIVGPNGCGKSNISDAVRWVLGEQSAKTLRGAKMEDVIFGGAEKRRRLSVCEVTLTIDNEDGALPINFAEVAVTRRVYRSGDSEYAINGTNCRLRDVVDLFRDTGIGKEGYSLIGQGRIDEILSAKSEDRRQIFEEAAGIVKFKTRKVDAERRMENTRGNLTRVEDILRELEGRIEPLKHQSETARAYLALRDELKVLELNVFLRRTDRYNARIDELKASLAAFGEAVEEAEMRRAALTAERDGCQETLARLEDESARMRDRVQVLIGNAEAREGVVSVLRERIAAGERDEKRVRADLQAAQSGGGGVQAQIEALAAEIAEARTRLEADRAVCAADAEALAQQSGALAELEETSEQKKTALIAAMNALSDVRSEQARLIAMRDALTARMDALRGDETDDLERGEDCDAQVRACRQHLETEREAKRALDKRAEAAVEKVKAFGEETARIAETAQALAAVRQEAASRLRVLEDMQRDLEGYQYSVKNVLRQAERTPNSGVRGVVATLIRVPKQIERAVDMALGGALQHVVVDREEDAKRMIEYLRANKLGRATFLPRSTVRGRTLDSRERAVLSMPGCLGVASELVACDPIYRDILDNLLGRTVIAENLDCGIPIMRAARQAFRLVTLDGDVMNPGGAMTGGSVHSNATSLLSRAREIEETRAALTEADAKIAETNARASALEAERANLKRERGALFDQLHQQEIAVAREEAHLAAALSEADAQSQRARRASEAMAQLQDQLADAVARLAAIEGQQSAQDDARERDQADVLAMQGEIARAREAVAALQKTVTDARVRIAAAERDLTARVADHARLIRRKDDIAKLRAESEAALADAEAALLRDRGDLARESEALSEEKATLNAARAAFDDTDGRRIAAQTALREATDALDTLRARIEELTDKRHRAEVQLTRVEAELSQLTDRVWEDYELSYEGAAQYLDPAFKLTESEKRIAEIRARVKAMGTVNVAAVDEYRDTLSRFESLNAQRDDLIKAELDLQKIVDDLVAKMETQFKREFAKLNVNFAETFVALFGGGQAELRLADPNDALGCGVDIVAQPPGKKLQMLSLLSGGERALTAIAILFAMLKLKPTPFCFLDEIEAALDDANIDNFAEYLRAYASKTQFVVVTHRKGTMNCCDALYGVAMEEKGVSRLVSVKLD